MVARPIRRCAGLGSALFVAGILVATIGATKSVQFHVSTFGGRNPEPASVQASLVRGHE